jgi:hypothetical protein
MDLFGDNDIQIRSISDYVKSGDVKGLINYLKSLDEREFRVQVLQAGYSMTGFNHGKSKAIEYVINQID